MGTVVHLACCAIDEAGWPGGSDPRDWLSDEELLRAEGIRSAQRLSQFMAGRWLLRTLLARVLGREPQDWRLGAPDQAPPTVLHTLDQPLHLGLGHSGSFVAAAAASIPVGIDIEAPRRRRDIDGLAQLCCTGAEQALLAAAPTQEREALFYGMWTVKEAWIKRRRESVAPRRLAGIDVRPALSKSADARVWQGAGWTLALVVRGDAGLAWHTPAPSPCGRWEVRDAQARAFRQA